MSAVEYVCTFPRAAGDRLIAAERLVVGLPRLLGPALHEVDLAYRVQSSFLATTFRFAAASFDAAARDRVAFWSARTGGRVSPTGTMAARELKALLAQLERCELRARAVPAEKVFDAAGRFFTDAGAPAARRRSASAGPVLAMDVGGPGWEGVSYAPDSHTLFVAAPLCPPVGDEVPLSFRVPGLERTLESRGIVLEVVPEDRAAPGKPAGYAIGLWSPPSELHEALSKRAPATSKAGARAAPRFRVSAPVRIVPATADVPPAPAPRALVEYASEQELAQDFVENLSRGGVFVRTTHPSPVGTPVSLELRLPNGAELRTAAKVVFSNASGMGLQFSLDPESEATLSAAITLISARGRRALVVDDDALARRMIADALSARGFEVLTAVDGSSGLQTLMQELLALDLLVTDVRMPGMDGEHFVRTIRRAGGESELAIVAVTGRLDEGIEPRLQAAGADAVLDKALGPVLIAQAADAVLERRRQAGTG